MSISILLSSTESGLGSDIFDANATDFGRHSSNMERVRFYQKKINMNLSFIS